MYIHSWPDITAVYQATKLNCFSLHVNYEVKSKSLHNRLYIVYHVTLMAMSTVLGPKNY